MVSSESQKICSRCATERSISDFRENAKCTRDGHEGVCNPCRYQRITDWSRSHPQKVKAYNKAVQTRYQRASAPETKLCRGCQSLFPISGFYAAVWSPDKHDTLCKACRHATNRKWFNPVHNPNIGTFKEKQKAKRLLSLFNLTPEDKQAILTFQKNVCAICKNIMKKPNCDHDHATGQIRGFLCPMCNRALGRFRDSLTRLTAAVEYMTNFPATQALGAPRFGLPGRVGTKKQRALSKKIQALTSE